MSRLLDARKTWTSTVLGLLTASLFTGSACSGHAPYPQTWPPLRQARGQSCARVAGRYRNQGERGQMVQYGPVYLTEMLFNQPPLTERETVMLSFPRPDMMDVIAGNDQLPRRLSLSRKAGQFKCDGSTLVIKTRPAEWVHGATMYGPVVGGNSVVMKVDVVDGSLIVTMREKDFLWLPFPGWSTWRSWYRFSSAPVGEDT